MLEIMVICLGAVCALCEIMGERVNFLLTADDLEKLESEGI